MRRPAMFWASAIGALVVLDVWCDRNETVGDTLSECTRVWFHTHHPLGRAAFVAAWGGLTCWLVPHILRKVEGSLS